MNLSHTLARLLIKDNTQSPMPQGANIDSQYDFFAQSELGIGNPKAPMPKA